MTVDYWLKIRRFDEILRRTNMATFFVESPGIIYEWQNGNMEGWSRSMMFVSNPSVIRGNKFLDIKKQEKLKKKGKKGI